MTITRAKLERFIKIRAESGFMSNLQFASDATQAGFDVDELGTPEKLGDGYYKWQTPAGTLVEKWGELAIIDE